MHNKYDKKKNLICCCCYDRNPTYRLKLVNVCKQNGFESMEFTNLDLTLPGLGIIGIQTKVYSPIRFTLYKFIMSLPKNKQKLYFCYLCSKRLHYVTITELNLFSKSLQKKDVDYKYFKFKDRIMDLAGIPVSPPKPLKCSKTMCLNDEDLCIICIEMDCAIT